MGDTLRNISSLSPAKRALLNLWRRKAAQNRETLPLSFAQQRLWFIDQLEPESPLYNIAAELQLTGRLDQVALENSLKEMIRRHEALRTVFLPLDGAPIQQINETDGFQLQIIDTSGSTRSDSEEKVCKIRREAAEQPFDLAHGPMIRLWLVQLGDEEHLLLVAMHHIVSDGWSVGILVQELAQFYEHFHTGRPLRLPELSLQYADYAVWQREWFKGKVLEQHLGYWRKQLAGLEPLELPSDWPRPGVMNHQGSTIQLCLPAGLTGELKGLAREEGATLFMVLLAGLQILLSRYCGKDDIAVCTPIAGRDRVEFEGLIGVFVNTLVMRADLSGTPGIREVIQRVCKMVLESHRFQNMPFEKLIEELQPERDSTNLSPFPVFFSLQNTPEHALQLPDLDVRVRPLDTRMAKFDLELSLWETGNELEGRLVYSTELFSLPTAGRFAAHYQNLLTQMACDRPEPISDLQILSVREQREWLVDWNSKLEECPSEYCVHELFEMRALEDPATTAVVCGEEQLTFAELNQRANQLAHYLREMRIKADTPVAVSMERSIDLIIALLGVMKAGGAYVPIDASFPTERVLYMLENAQAPVVLSHTSLLSQIPTGRSQVICLDEHWGSICKESMSNLGRTADQDNLVYIIYTSGSTGRPKGVMVRHRSLANILFSICKTLAIGAHDKLLATTTFSFDIAALELFAPLIAGAQLVIAGHLKGETRQLTVEIARRQPTILQATPTLWNLLLQQPIPFPKNPKILCGGELLDGALAQKLSQISETVWNVYGPTETTVWSTIYPLNQSHNRAVPIGRPIANTQVFILSDAMEPVPLQVAGELYIGGTGLARGYFGRPDLTAEKFVPNPYSREGGERLYRTGDRARHLTDGNLEFLGRSDYQIKLRGHRIELGEIEATVNAYPGIDRSIVVIREDQVGEPRLVAYVTGDQLDICALRNHLKARLPSYMVPAATLALDKMPCTPNGKVDRKALPAPDLTPGLEKYIGPRNGLEEILCDIWSEVLNVERVGIGSNFFELGGHSLLATQVMSRVRHVLGLELPLRILFTTPTVAEMASVLQAKGGEQERVQKIIVQTDRKGNLPLSFAQQRLWFLDQLVPGNPFYNIAAVFRLSGHLDEKVFEKSLREILKRHESLRTCFDVVNGMPVQRIIDDAELNISRVEITKVVEEQWAEIKHLAAAEGQKPFDLRLAPLLRFSLLKLNADEHVVLLTMHHIISDGWSLGVFVRELGTLYRSFINKQENPLEDLSIQYADYAAWQWQWLKGEIFNTQVEYWRKRLENLETLKLSTDRPRPAIQNFKGSTIRKKLDSQLLHQLKKLGRNYGVTLYMVLLSAFQLLLGRYSGQKKIVIGSPIANRTRREIEGMIGLFVNTLVLRGELDWDEGFADLLAKVKETTLGAYEHQDVPFEKLVEELQPERDLGRNPLFQVSLALQNMPKAKLDLPGLQLEQLEHEIGTTKFDLTLFAQEEDDALDCVMEYNSELWEAITIRRLLGHWEKVLATVVQHPETQIGYIGLLSQSEEQEIVESRNRTKAEYDIEKLAVELIEDQASSHPQTIAVKAMGFRLTYEQLNQRANQLAHYLRTKKIGSDSIVGVLLDRSVEMVIALFAIWKAGAAYLPLDSRSPAQRMAYMLEESGVKLVLSQPVLDENLRGSGTQVLSLEPCRDEIALLPEFIPERVIDPQNLAYVIYTSGSTGKPKGVAVTHGGLLNYLRWAAREYPVEAGASIVHSPLAFDLTVTSLLLPLISGQTVVLLGEECGIEELMQALKEGAQYSLVKLTPSHLQLLNQMLPPDSAPQSAHALVIGGEALTGGHIAFWQENAPSVRLINEYGPTETVVGCCIYEVQSQEAVRGTVPIGRPIANTRIFVVDERYQLVPWGVVGEIWVGGAGVARGYLGNPELTAERFVPDSWSGEAGTRIYRTGDLGRWSSTGELEYLGRKDEQVKIRGYRIELGEIEAMVSSHSKIAECAVKVQEKGAGDHRLVAYITCTAQTECDSRNGDWQAERIFTWKTVFDSSYSQGANEDVTFDTRLWISSYTGMPIPEVEMQEWVETTVSRVQDLMPEKLLEIGCGTGLLTFRLVPHCVSYWGTDISAEAVRRLSDAIRDLKLQWKATILWGAADDPTVLPQEPVDTVVLNSVLQYFPGADYTERVLEQAINSIQPSGGAVFLGDIRLLPCLEAFHASVLLEQASGPKSLLELREELRQRLSREAELCFSPEFFFALQKKIPSICSVQVQPKRGRWENELNVFRVDIWLRVGQQPCRTASSLKWIPWEEFSCLPVLERFLTVNKPDLLGIARVPDGRVLRRMHAAARIIQGKGIVETVRKELADGAEWPPSPEEIWALADRLGFKLEMNWAGEVSYNLFFRKRGTHAVKIEWPMVSYETTNLQKYVNVPSASTAVQFAGEDLTNELRKHIQERLPEYMIPVHFILMDDLPLTVNGKVDRKALPDPEEIMSNNSYVVPPSPIEEIVCSVVRNALGVPNVNIKDNFFRLGGHSLLASQVVLRINKLLAVDLPLQVLFKSPVLGDIAKVIEELRRRGQRVEPGNIARASREGALPQSFAQERLWFIDQLEPNSALYNIPQGLRITGPLEISVLEKVLSEIIRRHEVLRTSFAYINGQPVQVIHHQAPAVIELIDISNLAEPERELQADVIAKREASTGFDLSQAPLMRTKLVRLREDEHLLLATMHHIASDGWSSGVLLRELTQIYKAFSSGRASPLPELAVQYLDYAVWQRERLQGRLLTEQMEYWKTQLAGLDPLELPGDYERPQTMTHRGGTVQFTVGYETSTALKELASREGVTLFMTLLAALDVLLWRASGQRDIAVGTAVAGRNRIEVEGLIGFFVNMLAMRVQLDERWSFRELLARTRQVVLEAYEHQEVPFQMVVDEITPGRDLNRSPLFQVVLVFQSMKNPELQVPNLVLKPAGAGQDMAKFDLDLILVDSTHAGGFIEGSLNYSIDLFTVETANWMIGQFIEMLASVAKHPDACILELPFTPKDQNALEAYGIDFMASDRVQDFNFTN